MINKSFTKGIGANLFNNMENFNMQTKKANEILSKIEELQNELRQLLTESSESENPNKSKEQQMEEFFLEKLNSCEKVMNENYPDSVFFKCREGVLFEQDNKNKVFWVRYDNIWSVFEDGFKLDYKDTQKFILGMVEKHLKLEGFTPHDFQKHHHIWWKNI